MQFSLTRKIVGIKPDDVGRSLGADGGRPTLPKTTETMKQGKTTIKMGRLLRGMLERKNKAAEREQWK